MIRLVEGVLHLPKRATRTLDRWALSLDEAARAVSTRQLFGWFMVLLAVTTAAANPESGSVKVLASWGISPSGFALVVATCGGLMMAYRSYVWFVPLLLPMGVYVATIATYTVTEKTGSNLPIVFYVGLIIAGVVSNAREKKLNETADELEVLKAQLALLKGGAHGVPSAASESS